MTSNLRVPFEKLGEDHFIWLPLAKISVNEFIPVNSLKQPAFGAFEPAIWDTREKFTNPDQAFLGKLAQQYDEMGYFLLHHDGRLGILCVDVNINSSHDYRATIFNAQSNGFRSTEHITPIELNLVNSKLKLPWKDCSYKKGDIAHYKSVYIDDGYCEREDLYD